MKKEETMKQIADKYKRGWSFIDDGKGIKIIKKKQNEKKEQK